MDGVEGVHHVHVWQLDEHHSALEAHVVPSGDDPAQGERAKAALEAMLSRRLDVEHSTLEFEHRIRPG